MSARRADRIRLRTPFLAACGAALVGIAAFAVASPVPSAAADAPPAVRFEADGPRVESGEGHVVLHWRVEPETARTDGLRFEVELSRSETLEDVPERRYLGGNRALFVSGLDEGSHWFRVRAVDSADRAGPWSRELEVAVRYPGAVKVTILMLVGALVLLATVAVIAIGHHRTERLPRREGQRS